MTTKNAGLSHSLPALSLIAVLLGLTSCGSDRDPIVPAPPGCQVTPAELDFGTVIPGQTRDLSFTVKNTGGGTLTGSVSEDCASYGIESGAGDYALTAGQEKQITIRFSPAEAGTQTCAVDLGSSSCGPMACTGVGGDLPPACTLDPAQLDFGTVVPGQTRDLSFTITNTGGGTLTGSVSENCAAYSIVSGAEDYALTAGQERQVTVRFSPAAVGTQACSVELGATSCGPMACTGVGGELAPACALDPAQLEFGTVVVGQTRDLSFTITNTGGGTLAGSVSESCASYSIESGAGDYALTAGQERQITVRFSPAAVGTQSCSVNLGSNSCGSMVCTGVGDEPPPACEVVPAQLDFGTVVPGQFGDLSFTITNTGGGTLAGNVSESCVSYSIESGAGAYSLAAGQAKQITIRFSPSDEGTQTCSVELGSSSCAPVPCTGVAINLPPACEVNPTQLDFGSVIRNQFFDLSFTIKNIGGGILTASVSDSCDTFSIESGAGDYALTAGQEKQITIRFAPLAEGMQTCTVDLGSSSCAPVGCIGTGILVPPPEEVLIPGGGVYFMGSPESEPGRDVAEAQHRVDLTTSIHVSKYEVTQAEWLAVMGWNESVHQGASLPVENVTWFDAVVFCNQRSLLADRSPVYTITNVAYEGNHLAAAEVTANWAATGYRLLTEAEWEYVCRARSQAAFCNGEITNLGCAPVDLGLDAVGWYCGNAGEVTHEVGGKDYNDWRLFDLHGNVREWCWDWWGPYPTGMTVDPLGAASGTDRVARGGSRADEAQHCRSAARGHELPQYRDAFVGVRVARMAE